MFFVRSESENNIRRLIATNDQLNKDLRKANEGKQSQSSSMDQIKMQQRLGEMEELLSTTEAARKTAERRLTDCQEALNISFKDVNLSDMEVGKGSFGGVRVGDWCGCPVAVKILHNKLAKDQHQRRLFQQEVAMYSTLHHPNIAAICGVVQERDAPFCLIMELLQASLADVISSALASGKYLTLREQTDISHDCLSGLKYLHELPRPVLHGDIRPTNILLTSMMKAKLADLGAARFTDASLSVGPMSPLYIAPERLSDRIPRNNKEADVYSMGVTLCELFTGDQKNQVDRPRQLGSVDHMDLRLLCAKMACENAEKRASVSEALEINDRVLDRDEYTSCHPRRMVRGVMDGVQEVVLCDKPW